jgi:hypothetical protein
VVTIVQCWLFTEELVEQFRFFYVINYKITIMFNRGYSSAAFNVSC